MDLKTGPMPSSSVDFSVIDGGDLLYDLYGQEGPRLSAVLIDSVVLDLAADTVSLYVDVRQIPTPPPEWWPAAADVLFVTLKCHGAVDVDVHPGHPGSEGLVARGAPDGRVEVTFVHQDHRMSLVARECVLVNFRATRIRRGCGCG